jgi:hypothetical protein
LTACGHRLHLGQERNGKYRIKSYQLGSSSPCLQIDDGESKALERVYELTLPLADDHGSMDE